MRWLTYSILVYFIIAVQMALGGILSWGQAAPNLVLPAALFITINARREEALVGAFLLGAIQDLFTQQPPGLYAFSYGLVGLFVIGTQPAVYRDHPLTHFALSLFAALVTGAVILLNEWVYPLLHDGSVMPSPSISRMLGSAIYTSLLSPVLLALLVRIKWIFGFRNSRAHSSIARQSGSLLGN